MSIHQREAHLMDASITGDAKTVENLLRLGVFNLDQCLWHAAKNGHLDVVKLLLDAEAKIYTESADGSTDSAIQIAYTNGHEQVGDLLEETHKKRREQRDVEYNNWANFLKASR